MDLCKRVKHLDNLHILFLVYLGRFYSKTNNFFKAKKFLDQALYILDQTNESWKDIVMLLVLFQIHHCYMDYYICKKEIGEHLEHFHELLKRLGGEKLFYQQNYKNKIPDFILGSRQCMYEIYNRLGSYEQAFVCEEEASFIRKKYKLDYNKSNKSNPVEKANISSERGYTLLRVGSIKKAQRVLKYSIETKIKCHTPPFSIFYTLVNKIEADIRLRQLPIAYKAYQEALVRLDPAIHNRRHLCLCTLYYHAALIKYLQRDYSLSLQHFSDFFKNMDEFCEGFLEKEKYEELVQNKAFEVIEDPQQITLCFDHSLQIFTAIYGSEHPFVRDYVAKKGDLYTWWQKYLYFIRNMFYNFALSFDNMKL